MGQLSPGLAKYMAAKKAGSPAVSGAKSSPSKPVAKISPAVAGAKSSPSKAVVKASPAVDPDAAQDMVKLTPQLLHSIKNSRKGKVPSGLARKMAKKPAKKK